MTKPLAPSVDVPAAALSEELPVGFMAVPQKDYLKQFALIEKVHSLLRLAQLEHVLTRLGSLEPSVLDRVLEQAPGATLAKHLFFIPFTGPVEDKDSSSIIARIEIAILRLRSENYRGENATPEISFSSTESTRSVLLDLHRSGRLWLYGRDAFSDAEVEDFFPSPIAPTATWPSFYRTLEKAVSLLAAEAPECIYTFLNLIGGLVPLIPRAGTTESGGSTSFPNIIFLTRTDSVAFIIETLIHEGSHQLMLLAEYFFPFYQATDKVYYNPILGRERPIYGIVAAYHAFGLVTHYLPRFLDAFDPNERAEVEAKVARFKPALLVLEDHLTSTQELSNYGLMFFTTIRDFLQIKGGEHGGQS